MAAPPEDKGASASRLRLAHTREAIKDAATARAAAAAVRVTERGELQRALAAAPSDAARTALLESFEARARDAARERRKRPSISDYEPLLVIGRGAFGEVQVVRHRVERKLYALKTMSKAYMAAKNQGAHLRAERDSLVAAAEGGAGGAALSPSPWVVRLHASFQDATSLYIVMELCLGGDLMSLLIREDVLPESAVRIIAAECVLAIKSVHDSGFVHRDLKPDNILLDTHGHCRLTDLGLATRVIVGKLQVPSTDLQPPQPMSARSTSSAMTTAAAEKRSMLFSTVGTPDYISPEVLRREGYTSSTDWWSLGCVLYECVIGYPPFFADDPVACCRKVLSWRDHLKWPQERVAHLTPQCMSLLKGLLEEPAARLSVQEIMSHPFFVGVEWETLQSSPAPFPPRIAARADVITAMLEGMEKGDPAFAPLIRELCGSFDDFAALDPSDARSTAAMAQVTGATPIATTPGARLRSRAVGYTWRGGAPKAVGDENRARREEEGGSG